VEQIVGFVAAAVGRVAEFTQEAPFLTQTLLASQPGSSSSSNALAADAGALAALEAAAAASEHSSVAAAAAGAAAAGDSDDSSSAAAAAADALAVEVVLLGVVSGYRRQGVASRLLQQVKRHARSTG
jgi:GNAT superfamily N-acetyltransferase